MADIKGAAVAAKGKAVTVGGATLQYWVILEGVKAALGAADDASVRFLGSHLGGNETTLLNGALLFGALYVLHALGVTVIGQSEPTIINQGDTIVQTPVVNHNYEVHEAPKETVAAPVATPAAPVAGGQ